MDGEVAQLAALVISANHRLAYPQDPMRWFAGQRAFARCGEIRFEAATKRGRDKPVFLPLAASPSGWLDALPRSGTRRAVLGFERRDEELIPGETLPDRIAAGFAGGGSLWTMTTENGDGATLGWRGTWRLGFPAARDGRIWAVRYTATRATPQQRGRSVAAATTELRHALAAMSEFAWEHEAKAANTHFTSALALLEGEEDPLTQAHPMGPADTLDAPARHLLFATQRGWTFDNPELWSDAKLDDASGRDYAQRAEALYDAVTAAIIAAANASLFS